MGVCVKLFLKARGLCLSLLKDRDCGTAGSGILMMERIMGNNLGAITGKTHGDQEIPRPLLQMAVQTVS